MLNADIALLLAIILGMKAFRGTTHAEESV